MDWCGVQAIFGLEGAPIKNRAVSCACCIETEGRKPGASDGDRFARAIAIAAFDDNFNIA